MGKPTMWFPTRSDTNWSVPSQLEILDLKVEELYYPYSENKGADQLRGYREADLRLCFRICKLLVFSGGGSDEEEMICFSVHISMPRFENQCYSMIVE